MSKKVKIFLASIIAFFIIIISNNVYAASASIKAKKTDLEPGETTTITASVSATEAWNLKITASGGTISGTATNADSAGSEVSKDVISVNFTASEEGTYTITLSGQVTGSDLVKQEVTGQTVKISVKKPTPVTPEPEIPTTPEPEPETPTTPEPEKPTVLEFKSINEKVYATGTVNVRESYSASAKSLGQLKQGDSVTRIGISKTSSEGYNWSKITYNGKTAYVISSKLTTTEPTADEPVQDEPTQEPEEQVPSEEPTTIVNENNDTTEAKEGLNSLEIEGITLSPAFSPDVYEYRAILKENLNELAINAVTVTQGATVTIAGNDNLQEGENLITIVVYNENNTVEATYQITINKNTLDLSEADKILQMGNKEAKRNAMIYLVLLTAEIIVLIILMILKRRNDYYEEDYDEDYPDVQELTPNEQTVENTANETIKEEQVEEISQEETEPEIHRPRREKRKGKHF